MQLDLDHLDDAGMYVWAGIVAIASLAVAFGIAIWWQRSRDAKKKQTAPRAAED